jgi:hypothetical protein
MSHCRGILLSVIACLILLFPPCMRAQPISFVREMLRFSLADSTFAFSGIYVFDNPGSAPVEMPVYYPYVMSESLPDSTTIIDEKIGKNVPILHGQSGFSFVVTLPAQSTQPYRISFVQRARRQSLEYILKTTAAWGHPLDRATFTLRVPAEIILKFISMKPDTISCSGGVTTYGIEREHFMPGENLILRWGRRSP